LSSSANKEQRAKKAIKINSLLKIMHCKKYKKKLRVTEQS